MEADSHETREKPDFHSYYGIASSGQREPRPDSRSRSRDGPFCGDRVLEHRCERRDVAFESGSARRERQFPWRRFLFLEVRRPRGASVPVPMAEASGASFSRGSESSGSQSAASSNSFVGGRSSSSGGGESGARENGGGGSGVPNTPRGKTGGSSGGGERENGNPSSTSARAGQPSVRPPKAAAPQPANQGGGQATAPSNPIVTTAKSLWSADLGFGWYNKYYFRGLDIFRQVSPRSNDQGVLSTKLTLSYAREKDAFSIGFGSLQSVARQVTNGAALQANPNGSSKPMTRRRSICRRSRGTRNMISIWPIPAS